MSSETSGVTGRDPTNMVEHDEISNLNFFGNEPSSSEWTDEKHSLYLRSMEASFIHQLYDSLESSCLPSHKKKTKPHPNGQIINVGRGEPAHEQLENHQFLLSNPWIQHFRTRGRENKVVHEDASDEGQTTRCGGRTMYTCGLVNITEHSSGGQAYQDSCVGKNTVARILMKKIMAVEAIGYLEINK